MSLRAKRSNLGPSKNQGVRDCHVAYAPRKDCRGRVFQHPVSADEIQTCCHRFAEDYLSGRASMNLGHEKDTEDILVVESFIAPLTYTDHGKKVKKGSWILSSKILNLN